MNNAFPNGDYLYEEMYMTQPLHYSQGDGSLVYKLNKALYGHKQVSRAWFAKLHHTSITLAFSSVKCGTSLFMKFTTQFTILVLVYMDDMIYIISDSS